MQIKKIITKRFYQKHPALQLVYEWEEVFKRELNASYIIDFNNVTMAKKFGKLYNLFPLCTRKPALLVDMNPKDRITPHNNRSNVIPYIIDFYFKGEDDLNFFYKNYNKHKLIFISSIEVFEFLKSVNCPLNIEHLALSITDDLSITPDSHFDKEFDVLLMGRQNPVLTGWLERYRETHKDLRVVSCKREDGHYNYYDQNGVFMGNADEREGVIELLKKSRIGLYTTKGVDGDGMDDTHGFSQVTPRFLEYIATGNHIIARYIKNSDSDFYEMNKICSNTVSYEDFERQVDNARKSEVDMKFYSNYLQKHYTSTRVKEFNEKIKSI